jgi:two-component system response regulator AtoC
VGKHLERIADDALALLQGYDWPGNVRELENTIERAVVLATGPVVDAALIRMQGATASSDGDLPSARLHDNVEWAERESVKRALRRSGGVKKDAAEILGISQRALSYYLAKYAID